MRFPFLRLLALGTVLVAVPACASSETASARGGSSPITYEDIADLPARDAYEVVQTLRPMWLRGRARMSIQNPGTLTPVVYVDNMRFGDVGSLRQISADAVAEIRYIGASDATTRWGTGHAGGVIMVRMQG